MKIIEVENDELFYPIPDFENYWLNPKGELKKINDRGFVKLLKPSYHGLYPRVSLYIGKKKFNFFLHRLVAQMFVLNDKPRKRKIVNHKDLNKLNFHYSNLEWLSYSENNYHYHRLKKESFDNRKENKEDQLQ